MADSSFGVSSTEVTVVRIIPTTRNPAIWSNYELCELSNGMERARCKNCGGFFKKESNSSLKTHMEKSCPSLKKIPGEGQTSMTSEGGIWNFDPNIVRDRMAKLVIQQGLPFNHFDNPRVTRMIQEALQPRYHQVSRTTLRRDCLKMWKKARNELILGFEKLEIGVNLTTDVWSAPHGIPDSYICVTAHWVDPNTWQMMKRTISFDMFEYPHTGENLFYILDGVITDFKLQNKIFSISFDNASNNTNAVQKLILKYKPICNGVFFHSRCVAHIINLAVQDGLAVEPVIDLTNSFRVMLKDVFSSSKRRYHEYIKLCRDTGFICLGPNWDLPTRWNSTHKMFHSAIRQRPTLEIFHDMLSSKPRRKIQKFPSTSWNMLENITELLEVFKTATTFLSGVYYPTSPLALKQIFIMCNKLAELENKNPLLTEMIKPMKEKFVKYFKEMPPVITCAAALNPTINVYGVETLIDKISYDLDLDSEDINFSTVTKAYFNKCLQDLFAIYLNKYGTTQTPHNTMGMGAGASSSSSRNVNLNLYNEMRNEFSKRARGSTPSSELGRYIGTNFLSFMSPDVFEEFDILAWWKGNEATFPILSAMAHDVLTVQASTVASESVFSVSGRVLSIRRTRLTPVAMEMCICLKDHLDAVERIQDKSSLEDEIEVEEFIHETEVNQGLANPLTDEELAEDDRLRGSASNSEHSEHDGEE